MEQRPPFPLLCLI